MAQNGVASQNNNPSRQGDDDVSYALELPSENVVCINPFGKQEDACHHDEQRREGEFKELKGNFFLFVPVLRPGYPAVSDIGHTAADMPYALGYFCGCIEQAYTGGACETFYEKIIEAGGAGFCYIVGASPKAVYQHLPEDEQEAFGVVCRLVGLFQVWEQQQQDNGGCDTVCQIQSPYIGAYFPVMHDIIEKE